MLTEPWEVDAARRLKSALEDSELSLRPDDIDVVEDTDSFDDAVWKIVLTLPAPEGDTWDSEELYRLRRAAVTAFDALADQDSRVLPGSTFVALRTNARESDTAAPDAELVDGEGIAEPDGAERAR